MGTDKIDTTSDIQDIGPECFAYRDEVVSWKGQEFIRTCGEFVNVLPDGRQAFCTMAFNHPASVPHMNAYNLEKTDEESSLVTTDEEESSLVKHARRELELIGEDEDVIEWYLGCIRAFVVYGHSGGSAMATIPVLQKLLMHKHLAPLTDDPDEWYKHSAEMWDGVSEIWQNKRNTKMFSSDEGKSYWNVDNPSESKSSMPANMKDQPRPRSENYGR